MVDVFVIHSGKDYNYAKTILEPYLKGEIDEKAQPIKGACNANVLTLTSGRKSNWKKEASKKIKIAQVVIVVIGKDASESSKMATMGWEVRQAVKYNKQIMILNPNHNTIPEYLFQIDRFTKMNQQIAPEKSLVEIKKRIDDFANGYYDIYSSNYKKMSEEEKANHGEDLIEQYKVFQKTSEDLVTRRQNVNSFYISVNSALVALTGIIMGVIEMPTKFFIVIFMCLSGIILDISWVHILESYGRLNAAKIKVISLMELNLPIAAYDVEWQIMSDKLNNNKYVSFTNSEKKIPIIFLFIYSTIVLLTTCLLLYHYFA